MKNPARGGGRWVEVAPQRLVTWVESFAGRHPGVVVSTTRRDIVTFTAEDGAVAECHVPFPPMAASEPAGEAAVHQPGADLGRGELRRSRRCRMTRG